MTKEELLTHANDDNIPSYMKNQVPKSMRKRPHQ